MTLNSLAASVHMTAVDKGFWDTERNFGEMVALMHSELSEALEEHRAGRPTVYYRCVESTCQYQKNPSDIQMVTGHEHESGVMCEQKLLKPEGAAVELIDAMIRELDTLASMGVDIDELLAIKAEYNASREKMHGKKY